MNTLLLVDGNNLLHRAYHSQPKNMKAPDGTPTNAVFGLLRMLISTVKALKPSHLLICFDASRTTFRTSIYPQYKANRPEPEELLVPQYSLIRDVLNSLNIPFIEKIGYEADDLIGTVAARAKDFKTKIVTGDYDCLQLIKQQVHVYMKIKKAQVELTPENVKVHIGYMPSQCTDIKALGGDTSDNIPGVRGIGGVTALKLLNQYSDIEGVINAALAGDVPGKNGENIKNSMDDIRLFKQLVTIKKDVPIDTRIDDLVIKVNKKTGMEKLNRLGIRDIDLSVFSSGVPAKPVAILGNISNVDRIQVPTLGKSGRCGVCQAEKECRQYIELNDNGLPELGSKMFWACSSCAAVLSSSYYRPVKVGVTKKKEKQPHPHFF